MQYMPYCTNRKDIALTTKSYCTNRKHTSGKSTAMDQRTSRSLSDSIGLSKTVSIERMAATDQSIKLFEAMGGVDRSIKSQNGAA